MRIGVIKEIEQRGDRLVCAVLVDGEIERDFALLCPLHVRGLVEVDNTRAVVFAHEGNDVQRYALAVEFAVQTDQALIHPAGSGAKIHIASSSGAAQPLATLADLQDLRTYISTLVLPLQVPVIGPAGPPVAPPPIPAGTTVLEAE